MKQKFDITAYHQLADTLEEQINRYGWFNPKLKIFGRQMPPQRLQTMARLYGVDYINDAAAQSVDATYYSLNKTQGPLIWIVCNDDPRTAFEELSAVMVYKTRHIIACGRAAEKLERLFGSRIPVSHVAGPAEAVAWARRLARPGMQVLFSPATAYDKYQTEHLSRAFEKAVKKLRDE